MKALVIIVISGLFFSLGARAGYDIGRQNPVEPDPLAFVETCDCDFELQASEIAIANAHQWRELAGRAILAGEGIGAQLDECRRDLARAVAMQPTPRETPRSAVAAGESL